MSKEVKVSYEDLNNWKEKVAEARGKYESYMKQLDNVVYSIQNESIKGNPADIFITAYNSVADDLKSNKTKFEQTEQLLETAITKLNQLMDEIKSNTKWTG